MNAIYLTLFVSLILAVLGVLLFLRGVHMGDQDHTERLALLPLDDDENLSAQESNVSKTGE